MDVDAPAPAAATTKRARNGAAAPLPPAAAASLPALAADAAAELVALVAADRSADGAGTRAEGDVDPGGEHASAATAALARLVGGVAEARKQGESFVERV